MISVPVKCIGFIGEPAYVWENICGSVAPVPGIPLPQIFGIFMVPDGLKFSAKRR